MKKLAAYACVMFISSLGFFASQVKGQDSSREDFEKFCKMNEGRWICDITWVADWPGVGKKGEKVRVYSQSTISEDGNALIEKAYMGNGSTTRIAGYDAGNKRIKGMEIGSGGNVGQYIVYEESGRWIITGDGSEADGTKSRFSITMTISDNGNTLTFSGSVWMGERKIDVPGDVWRRVSK